MAMGRMWAVFFDGENGGGGGAPLGGLGRELALLFVVGGLLRWPLRAVAGVVN